MLWDKTSLVRWRNSLPAGHKLVLTNGCFDIFHAGHADFLMRARRLGHYLLVLFNSDKSMRELKGPGRPVCAEEHRAIVLDAVEYITAFYVFDDKRITKLLALVQPDIWVKGGDYTVTSLDPEEVKAAQAVGCRIEIIPVRRRLSTTKILASLS